MVEEVKSPITGFTYKVRPVPTKIGLKIIGRPEAEATEMILKACVLEKNNEKIKDIDDIPFVDAIWLIERIMEISGLDKVLELSRELPKNQ